MYRFHFDITKWLPNITKIYIWPRKIPIILSNNYCLFSFLVQYLQISLGKMTVNYEHIYFLKQYCSVFLWCKVCTFCFCLCTACIWLSFELFFLFFDQIVCQKKKTAKLQLWLKCYNFFLWYNCFKKDFDLYVYFWL